MLARLPTEYKFTAMFWHNGENDTFNRYERHTTQVRERVWKTSPPDPRAQPKYRGDKTPRSTAQA